jgi:hypothetical protein
MNINFLVVLLTAMIPLALGFVWYHEKVFGAAWMNASGVTKEMISNSNMGMILGVSFLLSFFVSFGLQFMVIHQFHLYSLFEGMEGVKDPGSPAYEELHGLLAKHGESFRTFKHGALHGTIVGLLFITPILAINALFERKGFKYIAVHGGYWTLTALLMGGVLCAFAK